MDQRTASRVIWLQAVETADVDGKVLPLDTRRTASLEARRKILLQASGDETALDADRFLDVRARLLTERLPPRQQVDTRHLDLLAWLRLPAAVLPLLVLCSGLVTERIANPHRMDLLSLPLLAIIGWNLLAYAGKVVARAGRYQAAGLKTGVSRWWLMLAARLAPRTSASLSAAHRMYVQEYARLSAPVALAMLQRTLHASAGLFALGVAASLYLRGLTVEYRVGWESTFLDASQVHTVLSVLFSPVTGWNGVQAFTVDDAAALHFSTAGGAVDGEPWIHRYALLLATLVIIPRTVLAALAYRRERRLRRQFPVDLDAPYFRRVLNALDDAAPTLRVLPYSFSIDEPRDARLRAWARQRLGDTARLSLRPNTAYGGDIDQAFASSAPGPDDATQTIALFNLSATPEMETHGAFLQALKLRFGDRFGAAVDESGYASRLGAGPDAEQRLRQRRELWRDFAGVFHVPVSFVDLGPDDGRR